MYLFVPINISCIEILFLIFIIFMFIIIFIIIFIFIFIYIYIYHFIFILITIHVLIFCLTFLINLYFFVSATPFFFLFFFFRYLNFLKIGPKLLKWLPGKKASDLRTWLTVYGYWSEGTYSICTDNLLLYKIKYGIDDQYSYRNILLFITFLYSIRSYGECVVHVTGHY